MQPASVPQTVQVCFDNGRHGPLELPLGANPSEHLDMCNSPLLFGCRTGICGTCLVAVTEGYQHVPPPDEDEREVLEVIAPDEPYARLACRLRLTAPVKLAVLES